MARALILLSSRWWKHISQTKGIPVFSHGRASFNDQSVHDSINSSWFILMIACLLTYTAGQGKKDSSLQVTFVWSGAILTCNMCCCVSDSDEEDVCFALGLYFENRLEQEKRPCTDRTQWTKHALSSVNALQTHNWMPNKRSDCELTWQQVLQEMTGCVYPCWLYT